METKLFNIFIITIATLQQSYLYDDQGELYITLTRHTQNKTVNDHTLTLIQTDRYTHIHTYIHTVLDKQKATIDRL